MTIVRFPEYRNYEAVRIEASNAMMALLAGAQLSSHLLRLTTGSSLLLPDVFPEVPHIRRFNLKSEEARAILDTAEQHLGAMAVPYALSVHEDYLKSCLKLLEDARLAPRGQARRMALASLHAAIARAVRGTFDSNAILQIDTVRQMRNCLIHSGGTADKAVVKGLGRWTSSTEAAWVRIVGNSPRGLSVGDSVRLGHPEMILTLAVTKRLARQANELLQASLPRTMWADIVVADVRATTPSLLRRSDAMKKVAGNARHNYGALRLTDPELSAAIARA